MGPSKSKALSLAAFARALASSRAVRAALSGGPRFGSWGGGAGVTTAGGAGGGSSTAAGGALLQDMAPKIKIPTIPTKKHFFFIFIDKFSLIYGITAII
jgi:hypothetical protein